MGGREFELERETDDDEQWEPPAEELRGEEELLALRELLDEKEPRELLDEAPLEDDLVDKGLSEPLE